MLAKSRVFGACVVTAALLAAGCSSGGGKRSTPTTAAKTPSDSAGTVPVETTSTGVVTGYIRPCVGAGRNPVPFAAGTVHISTVDAPEGAGFARDEHLGTNQRYRFALPAGRYSLRAAYAESGIPQSPPFGATVRAGQTVRLDVGTPCK